MGYRLRARQSCVGNMPSTRQGNQMPAGTQQSRCSGNVPSGARPWSRAIDHYDHRGYHAPCHELLGTFRDSCPARPATGSANVNEVREWKHRLVSTGGALTNVCRGTRPRRSDILASHVSHTLERAPYAHFRRTIPDGPPAPTSAEHKSTPPPSPGNVPRRLCRSASNSACQQHRRV